MAENKTIVVQIRELYGLSVNQLRDKYAALYGEEARTRNKPNLIKRIAYRIQERAEGSLSDRARRRAQELADEAHIRVRPPALDSEDTAAAAAVPSRDDRLPPVGAVIVREYKGSRHEVTVLSDGFAWRGSRYRSLSAVAREITSTPWNGFRFFQKGLKAARRAARLAQRPADAPPNDAARDLNRTDDHADSPTEPAR